MNSSFRETLRWGTSDTLCLPSFTEHSHCKKAEPCFSCRFCSPFALISFQDSWNMPSYCKIPSQAAGCLQLLTDTAFSLHLFVLLQAHTKIRLRASTWLVMLKSSSSFGYALAGKVNYFPPVNVNKLCIDLVV